MKERLTKEDIACLYNGYKIKGMKKQVAIDKALGELYDYKEIEEELEIDFETLYKVSKEDCYFKNPEGVVFRAKPDYFDLENHYIHVKHGGWYSFKKYGVTWSLNREEME